MDEDEDIGQGYMEAIGVVYKGEYVWLAVPEDGFGIDLSWSEIEPLAKPFRHYGPRGEERFRIGFRIYYGSHADDWQRFDVTAKDEVVAQEKVVEKFNHWVNTSQYAYDVREAIGITKEQYVILPHQ